MSSTAASSVSGVEATLPWRRLALLVLAVAQFVVVLDGTIVNVSLPTIQHALHFRSVDLSWVANGYLLTFGGLLLFGGRLADVIGRRLVFLAGLVGFGVFSLACGLSQSSAELVTFRVLQGATAALVAPSALALILVTFTEPAARSRAFGVYGAASGAAGAVGVLAGGLLTQHAGWRWVFLINVPIIVAVAVVAPRAVAESRASSSSSWSQIDVPGALLGTGGLALLVYGFVQTDQHAWGSARTVGLLSTAAVVLVVFVLVELRQRAPMLQPRLLTIRTVAVGNLVGLGLGGGLLGSGFFFTSLYLQQVLGYSAQTAGLAYLPLSVLAAVGSRAGGRLLQRSGGRTLTTIGLTSLAVGFAVFSTFGTGESYAAIVGPMCLLGLGLGLGIVGINDSATSGVSGRTAGQVGALVTAAQRVGASVGLAVVASFAYRRVAEQVAHRVAAKAALASGYDRAFGICAGILAVAALAAVVGLRKAPVPSAASAEGSRG